jgi:hemerythrin-like domain-containing protein
LEAAQILITEHRLIEQVLDILDAAADLVEAEVEVRPGLFLDAADFIRHFADGCHHKKEEGALFQAMAACGVPVFRGPIGAMLADHELGREYTRQMRQAAEGGQNGDHQAAPVLVSSARAYASLLRMHILKEDRVLFPMAAQALPLEEQGRLAQSFEKIEREQIGEGVKEKYQALAASLTFEVAALSAAQVSG